MTASLPGLDDADCLDPARVGPKAATLAALRHAGFRVPDAVVIPTDLTAPGRVTARVERAVAGLASRLPAPWAVRSSALDEDGSGRSMAGQHTTVLRVEPEGLLEAVAACLASEGAHDGKPRVATVGGAPEAGRMAVVVQAMVSAAVAGVAMTRDPVRGTDEVVVEAVPGTAEHLTGGQADPWRWRVDADGEVHRDVEARRTDHGDTLPSDQVARVAILARAIADARGAPQDVEWALDDDGDLHVLQARPITGTTRHEAAPALAPSPEALPPGHWTRDPFHEPIPVSRCGLEVKQRQIIDQFPRLFAEFGILLHGLEQVRVGGWHYHRTVPLVGRGGATRGAAGPPPRWLLWLGLRLHPRLRARVATARRVVAEDESMRILSTWDAVRDDLAADIDRALDLDLPGLDDDALGAELDHRLAVISGAGWPHVQLMQAAFVVLEEFFACCEDLLGWAPPDCLVLLDGLSHRSTEPSRLIEDLAARARVVPAVRAALRGPHVPDIDELAGLDPAFADAFTTVVRRIGHRTPTYDVVEPTLAERPATILAQVARALATDAAGPARRREVDRRREDAERRARQRIAGAGPVAVARFDDSLRRARVAYPVREDRVWETTSVQLALLRYLAIELGARLTRRGQLERPDDVFHLPVPTVRGALATGGDLRTPGVEARRLRAVAVANPPPLRLGGPPPEPPPLDLLPPEARLVQRAAMQSASQGEATAPPGGPVLAGVPASTGRATGPVRLVAGPDDLALLHAGDVVVCATASPTWSWSFPAMTALLSDTGGVLSHPAIIAREHGLPAVLGLGDITSRVTPGQVVTVDGSAGTVHLHGPGAAAPAT